MPASGENDDEATSCTSNQQMPGADCQLTTGAGRDVGVKRDERQGYSSGDRDRDRRESKTGGDIGIRRYWHREGPVGDVGIRDVGVERDEQEGNASSSRDMRGVRRGGGDTGTESGRRDAGIKKYRRRGECRRGEGSVGARCWHWEKPTTGGYHAPTLSSHRGHGRLQADNGGRSVTTGEAMLATMGTGG